MRERVDRNERYNGDFTCVGVKIRERNWNVEKTEQGGNPKSLRQ